MLVTLSALLVAGRGCRVGGVFVGGGGVGSEGERNGRSGGEGWAPPISRLVERVTRGKRVGTERGVFVEPGLLRLLPLLELFRGGAREVMQNATHANI